MEGASMECHRVNLQAMVDQVDISKSLYKTLQGNLIILFIFLRSKCYREHMKEKKKKSIEKIALAKGQNCKSWSPQKIMKSKTSGIINSFICRKSSQICKMFPKSPIKFVAVLSHIWEQSWKDPVKRRLMHEIWSSSKELSAIMLKLGKEHACKNKKRVAECVEAIKNKYMSLCKASSNTSLSWTQFRHYCSIQSSKKNPKSMKYLCKLNIQNIESIQNHMLSEDMSFPCLIGSKLVNDL